MPTYAEYLEAQSQIREQQGISFERLQNCYQIFTKGLDQVDIQLRQDIACAAAETDTNPTEAQKKAGTYRKGKFTVHGLTIAIENPKGSLRKGVDKDGKPWAIVMKAHYGYILRTESEADGDHIDIFIGDVPEYDIVYVVDQNNPDTGIFDEHKCCLGFRSAKEAEAAYRGCYAFGWRGFANITPVSIEAFKDWCKNGNTGEPVALEKTLSYLDSSRGGALVPPPAFGAKIKPNRNRTAILDPQKLKELRHKYRRKGILSSVERAGKYVAEKWEHLEARYGRRVALSMALGLITPESLPGNLAEILQAAQEIRGISTYARSELEDFGIKGWITIGGGPCEDPDEGEHCGGTHVEIDASGTIRKGPRNFVGRRPNELRRPQAKPSSRGERKPAEQSSERSSSPPEQASKPEQSTRLPSVNEEATTLGGRYDADPTQSTRRDYTVSIVASAEAELLRRGVSDREIDQQLDEIAQEAGEEWDKANSGQADKPAVQEKPKRPELPKRPEATKKELKKSKAPVTYDRRSHQDLQEFSEALLSISDLKDYASLVGAPDEAQVSIRLDEYHGNPAVEVFVEHPQYSAIRYLGEDEDGNRFIKNDTFFMKTGQTGTGLGTKVFSDQVAWAKDMGFSYIKTDAARSANMNGYYTWMRQGYDAPVDSLDGTTQRKIEQAYPQAKTVLDIMSTPEGREWWKENGTWTSGAVFDLTEGSRSWKVHEDYLQERAGRK